MSTKRLMFNFWLSYLLFFVQSQICWKRWVISHASLLSHFLILSSSVTCLLSGWWKQEFSYFLSTSRGSWCSIVKWVNHMQSWFRWIIILNGFFLASHCLSYLLVSSTSSKQHTLRFVCNITETLRLQRKTEQYTALKCSKGLTEEMIDDKSNFLITKVSLSSYSSWRQTVMLDGIISFLMSYVIHFLSSFSTLVFFCSTLFTESLGSHWTRNRWGWPPPTSSCINSQTVQPEFSSPNQSRCLSRIFSHQRIRLVLSPRHHLPYEELFLSETECT